MILLVKNEESYEYLVESFFNIQKNKKKQITKVSQKL